MIQRYGTVNKAGEKIQRKYVKKAMPEGKEQRHGRETNHKIDLL